MHNSIKLPTSIFSTEDDMCVHIYIVYRLSTYSYLDLLFASLISNPHNLKNAC
jgi:hypothetical protein